MFCWSCLWQTLESYPLCYNSTMAASNDVELTEDDVPGAKIEEPLENATIPALKRWLL